MPKVTECNSEIGKTVGLIDTIINSFQILMYRNLEHPEVLEAIKDLHCNKELRMFMARALGFNADNLNEAYEIEQLTALMENRKIGDVQRYIDRLPDSAKFRTNRKREKL